MHNFIEIEYHDNTVNIYFLKNTTGLKYESSYSGCLRSTPVIFINSLK